MEDIKVKKAIEVGVGGGGGRGKERGRKILLIAKNFGRGRPM